MIWLTKLSQSDRSSLHLTCLIELYLTRWHLPLPPCCSLLLRLSSLVLLLLIWLTVESLNLAHSHLTWLILRYLATLALRRCVGPNLHLAVFCPDLSSFFLVVLAPPLAREDGLLPGPRLAADGEHLLVHHRVVLPHFLLYLLREPYIRGFLDRSTPHLDLLLLR